MIYPVAVSHRGKDDWLCDVHERQRNVVFPDTVQNEARFWRNIVSRKAPLTTAGKVGLAILAFFVFGTMASVVSMILRDEYAKQVLVTVVVGVLLVFGPIFGGIVWGTRRALRKIQRQHNSKTR